VNIKMRDAPNEDELDPIVDGSRRGPVGGRMRSFRDSDDGAGLDAIDDEESVRLAPASSRRSDAGRMVRGGNYDDGL
jgi:hypothetical protein